ncbi:hypothetical protein, partial [Streptomyces sp. NPDC003522]
MELDYELLRESANVVNVERPTGESRKSKTNPADRESEPKGSDRVGTAGKETAKKSGGLESTEEIGSGNGLIESETQDRREAPGGKPE